LCLSPPTEGFPWDDLRKILLGCHQMAMVPNGVETFAENFNRLSRYVYQRYRQTDRRQTDGRTTTYSVVSV